MDDRWQQSAALQALPKDVLKKLQAYQEEADQLKEEVKVSLAFSLWSWLWNV